MKLFRKKKPEVIDIYDALPTEHKASIEIVAHKNAQEDEIKKVKIANKHLQEVFEKNHFTLKIYLAAGGKTRLVKHQKGSK